MTLREELARALAGHEDPDAYLHDADAALSVFKDWLDLELVWDAFDHASPPTEECIVEWAVYQDRARIRAALASQLKDRP